MAELTRRARLAFCAFRKRFVFGADPVTLTIHTFPVWNAVTEVTPPEVENLIVDWHVAAYGTWDHGVAGSERRMWTAAWEALRADDADRAKTSYAVPFRSTLTPRARELFDAFAGGQPVPETYTTKEAAEAWEGLASDWRWCTSAGARDAWARVAKGRMPLDSTAWVRVVHERQRQRESMILAPAPADLDTVDQAIAILDRPCASQAAPYDPQSVTRSIIEKFKRDRPAPMFLNGPAPASLAELRSIRDRLDAAIRHAEAGEAFATAGETASVRAYDRADAELRAIGPMPTSAKRRPCIQRAPVITDPEPAVQVDDNTDVGADV